MTWNTTALTRASLDATTDNVASGLSELHTAIGRVNEMLAHPASPATTAWPLVAQSIVQVVTVANSTWTNIPGSSYTIPLDNTIPQSTEGYQILSQSFTPKSATSTILIKIDGYAISGGTAIYDSAILSLFDGSANAIAAKWVGYAHAANIDHISSLSLTKTVSSGSVSARTYSARLAPTTTTGNVAINGNSSGALLGGVSSVTMTIMEIV